MPTDGSMGSRASVVNGPDDVDRLAREGTPAQISVAALLDEIETALSASPKLASTERANRERVSAMWRIVHSTRKRMSS